VTHEPAIPVDFRWHGRDPVGLRSVETTQYDAIGGVRRFTEEGVRWQRVTATGTIAGDRVDSVTGVSFRVYRRSAEYDVTP
jgi:hypothetical protein